MGRFSLAIGAEDGTRATPAAKPERRSRGKLADTSSGRSQTDAVGSEAISNVQRNLHSTLQ